MDRIRGWKRSCRGCPKYVFHKSFQIEIIKMLRSPTSESIGTRSGDEVPAEFKPTTIDERYLWLSFMTSGEYADQACIADEYTASEFEAQQHSWW